MKSPGTLIQRSMYVDTKIQPINVLQWVINDILAIGNEENISAQAVSHANSKMFFQDRIKNLAVLIAINTYAGAILVKTTYRS